MLRTLIEAIVDGDEARVLNMLQAEPGLVGESSSTGATRQAAQANFFSKIGHYVYEGDTALHMAAAAHRPAMVARLIALGADVAARNRRKAQPLHYAVAGSPGLPGRLRADQVKVIELLIAAGADPNGVDMGGVTPLHRAVRNRCTEAVRALLENGADPKRPNGAGSTPMRLAEVTSGRGGTGLAEAKAEQARIVALLEAALRQA